jgi:hypothetical protein
MLVLTVTLVSYRSIVQFTWQLHCIVGSLWFGLCNVKAKQVITGYKAFCVAVFAPSFHMCTAYIVCTTGNVILDSSIDMGKLLGV